MGLEEHNKIFHAFRIHHRYLKDFLLDVQSYDEMGGNTVVSVDLIDDFFTIVFYRKFSYPFIIDELNKKWPQ